jgi:4-hydroxybenzoate polyprenyltransferase
VVIKLLASFARFVHFSNILIGAATVALCIQTAVLLDWLYIPNWFLLFMFSNTILQYGLHDLFTKKGTTNAKPKLAFWIKNRPYFIASIVLAAITSSYFLFQLKWIQLLWLATLGALTLAYSFPVLPFKQLRRFKQNGIVKLTVLVIVWTVSTTVLPATFIPYGFDEKFWWLLALRFLFMLAICIPFDVRDDITDVKTARHTLVSLIGEKKCYQFSYACLLATAILLIPGYYLHIPNLYLVGLWISIACTAWMVFYSSRHMFSPTSYIMLDASMLLQTVLVCTAMLIP